MNRLILIFSVFTLLSLVASQAKAAQLEPATKMPEVVVSSERAEHDEDKPVDPDAKVGSYQQPRWSASRSFAASRAYVAPEGEVEFEFWVQQKVDRATHANYFLIQKEIEVGLGHGLQIDIYQNDQKNFGSRALEFEGMQYELRWALAKWGELPLNPTLYFEYHQREVDPDRFEFRLLFADDFGAWRTSSNLAYETDLWSPKATELAATLGVARSVTRSLMFGVEAKAEGANDEAKSERAWEYYMGPSIRWNPTSRANLLLTTLIGFNDNSHITETAMVAGIDF